MSKKEPEPVGLPHFVTILESFYDAPYGAQLVIKVFSTALAQHHAMETCFMCKGGVRSINMCDAVPDLVDPEPPQRHTRSRVFAVLVDDKQGCRNIVNGYKRTTTHDPREGRFDLGEEYTEVSRGVKWLVKCALLGLDDAEEYDTLRKLLMVPQPKYDSVKEYEYQTWKFFGPGDMLAFALWLFTVGSRSDEAAIETIVEILMREALIVAAIWDHHFQNRRILKPNSPVPYAWYVKGVLQGLSRFKAAINGTPPVEDTLGTTLPYQVRVGLEDVRFIELWNSLWNEACGVVRTNGWNDDRLSPWMYKLAVNMVAAADLSFLSKDIDMKALPMRLWKSGRLDYKTGLSSGSSQWSPSCAHTMRAEEVDGIPSADEHRKSLGSSFYEYDIIESFWKRVDYPHLVIWVRNEVVHAPRDNETDEPEAYGPYIPLLHYGSWDFDTPINQNRTIYQEPYGVVDFGINACGHFFHLECIHELVNGTARNANKCPILPSQDV